jgi:integrase
MPYHKKQLPKYCKHKSSGRAFVCIGGKMYYLGKYGSQTSRREYDRIIGEFVANGRQPMCDPDEILVESLIVRFLDDAEKNRRYRPKRQKMITSLLKVFHDLYGSQPVSSFGPSALKAIRQRFVESGLARCTVNAYIGIIQEVFCWGAVEEIIPAGIDVSLRTVRKLREGQTAAIDYDPIAPVSDAVVERTMPHLPPQIQDMIRVQRLISGRPQDIFNMRFCDIDTSDPIWKYVPFTHKTKHKGKLRALAIGPKVQQILQKYFDRGCTDAKQFVFPKPDVKDHHGYYARAIKHACQKAGIPPWTPNQLRHTGGTEVRNKFGLEYAQAVLGHASASTTEIYAKVSFDKAAEVAAEIG